MNITDTVADRDVDALRAAIAGQGADCHEPRNRAMGGSSASSAGAPHQIQHTLAQLPIGPADAGGAYNDPDLTGTRLRRLSTYTVHRLATAPKLPQRILRSRVRVQ